MHAKHVQQIYIETPNGASRPTRTKPKTTKDAQLPLIIKLIIIKIIMVPHPTARHLHVAFRHINIYLLKFPTAGIINSIYLIMEQFYIYIYYILKGNIHNICYYVHIIIQYEI